MPIQVRLIVADPARCDWLKNILGCEPRLTVVSDDPNVDDGRYADLFIIDLAHPQASRPRVWMVIHLMYSKARLMAVADQPVDEAALQAALHAGATHFVEWLDPPARFGEMALAAYERRFRIAPGVFAAASALFSHLDLDEQSVQIGDLRVELTKPQVRLNNRPVGVTSHEYKILAHLARNAGRVVPYAELLRVIWGHASPIGKSNNQLKSTIKRLRHKIESAAARPQYLRTAHGYGYYMPTHLIYLEHTAPAGGNSGDSPSPLDLTPN